MEALDALLQDAMSKAMSELSSKTLRQVQYETAIAWAGRALASYERYARTRDLVALLDAQEYEHESREHAALVEDPDFAEGIGARLSAARAAVGL